MSRPCIVQSTILSCVYCSLAFKWVGLKIAQCVSGRADYGEEKGDMGEGKKSQRACKRERQRQRQEDRAYREVETYDYEQYG